MIRVLIKSVVDSTIGKLFTGRSFLGSEYNNRSLFQHYGFASLPPENSKGIVIKQGELITCIATEPPEGSKPTVTTTGDVVIYTASGTIIKINQSGSIEIQGDGTSGSISLGKGTLKKLINESIITAMNAHTHTGGTLGGGLTGPPTYVPPLSTTIHATSETVAS